MFTHETLRGFVYRDLAHASTANDRLTTTMVTQALNNAYAAITLDVFKASFATGEPRGIFAREATIPIVDDQALYDLPQDMFELRAVSYNSRATRLSRTSVNHLSWENANWRSSPSGTPKSYYLFDIHKLGLYPPPAITTSTNVLLEGFIVPFAVGGGIVSLQRATNVVTVVTNRAHKLTTADTIVIHGAATTPPGTGNFNGTFAVASVVDDTTFTYAQAGSSEAGTGGTIYYDGGVGLLYANDDIPAIPAHSHLALVAHAVWSLAAGLLADAAEAERRMAKAQAEYQEYVAALVRNLA